MNVLIVAAHPDDEVLGAGGVAARHARNGDEVAVAIMGEGITSRRDERLLEESRSALAALRQDAHRATSILGVKHLNLFDLPDNRFDSVDMLDIVKIIERLANTYKPEVVYTHFAGDLNIDHVITARAVLTAFRPLPGITCRRIYAFEVPSATGWNPPSEYFAPNVFVDIGDTLQQKLDAMAAYRSELRDWPHPRALEALTYRARYWGSMVGLEAAEPFILLREVIL